jgi:Na+-translocating ferredoxin:NAD+ oxidoreductase subunit G
MSNPIKHYIKESWLLLVAAIVFGLTLAGFQAAWAEEIAANQKAKFVKKAQILLPKAVNFEKMEFKDPIKIETKKGTVEPDIQRATDSENNLVGYAFICEGPGFADKIEIVVAVDEMFETVAGFGVLKSNETPGFGTKIANDFYQNQYKGIPVGKVTLSKIGDAKKIDSEIIAITGATISSEAVVKIFNSFIPEIKEQLKAKGLI